MCEMHVISMTFAILMFIFFVAAARRQIVRPREDNNHGVRKSGRVWQLRQMEPDPHKRLHYGERNNGA